MIEIFCAGRASAQALGDKEVLEDVHALFDLVQRGVGEVQAHGVVVGARLGVEVRAGDVGDAHLGCGGQQLRGVDALGQLHPQEDAAVRLGVFNVSVPIGSRFSTINGSASINFTATATATVEDPQEGSFYFQLTAETPGAIGNEYTGAIVPITTIPGLTSAQITDILVPGDDVETDSALRSRLIDALNNHPFGGNIAAYRTEILAIDGVGAVQVYPTWNGGGTVKCSILGSDFLPASPQLVQNVQTAIDPPTQGLGLGMAPIGAQVTIVAPTELTVNISATLTLSAGYSIPQIQSAVETAIEAYMLTVRQSWGNNVGTTNVEYAADVYVARVIAAILTVPGVVNATSVQLNGGTSDLILTETGTAQQVPVTGTVTLSE